MSDNNDWTDKVDKRGEQAPGIMNFPPLVHQHKLETNFDPASGYIEQKLIGPDPKDPVGNPQKELLRWVVRTRQEGVERALVLLGWTPPNDWIPCRKHLPAKGERVLVTDGKNCVGAKLGDPYEHGRTGLEWHCDRDVVYEWDWVVAHDGITHWKKMPELPK